MFDNWMDKLSGMTELEVEAYLRYKYAIQAYTKLALEYAQDTPDEASWNALKCWREQLIKLRPKNLRSDLQLEDETDENTNDKMDVTYEDDWAMIDAIPEPTKIQSPSNQDESNTSDPRFEIPRQQMDPPAVYPMSPFLTGFKKSGGRKSDETITNGDSPQMVDHIKTVKSKHFADITPESVSSPIPLSQLNDSLVVSPPRSPCSIKLFEDFVFLCAKPFFRISLNILIAVLKFHGAEVMRTVEKFAKYENKIRVCLIGELVYFDKENIKKQLRHRLGNCRCVKINYQWIFDILAANRLLPIVNHLFDDSTVADAIIAGIPEELLNL